MDYSSFAETNTDATVQMLETPEDVYKRQALHDPARAKKIRTGALNAVGKNSVVVMAVSYTHLDVYKRQMYSIVHNKTM